MNQKLLFIVNPHAGKAEIRGKLLELVCLFTARGWQVELYPTQRRLDACELLTRRAGEFDLIVCCGGDGTLNETVSGLIASGARVPLGYIPAGTVNDFASSLHLSKNMLEAAQTILDGRPFSCDVGSFGGRYFTYIAGFGAFTDVSYQTSQETKNLLGRAAYLLEAIRQLPNIQAYHICIEHDGQTLEDDFIFGMVSNATSVGGFKMLEPGISMSDGLFEVLLVRQPPTLLKTQALISAILHQDLSSEFLVCFRTTSLTVLAAQKVPWTLDGEYGGCPERVEIHTCKHALEVLVND